MFRMIELLINVQEHYMIVISHYSTLGNPIFNEIAKSFCYVAVLSLLTVKIMKTKKTRKSVLKFTGQSNLNVATLFSLFLF